MYFSLLLAACDDESVDRAPIPPPSFEVVHGWPDLPDGELLGQASGVGVQLDGDVMVFRRADREWGSGALSTEPIAAPTVMRFDAESGALVSAVGAGAFAMPHGLTVAPDGHLWLTDVALHQVFELDEAGNVIRTFGERGVFGADEAHFNMPTDVAVAGDGTFWVADGYGNGRVLKFAPDGTLIAVWGGIGTEPGKFLVPHGIALDPDGNVYVADRGNARVQAFTPDGELRGVWQSEALGRPWSIAFDPDGLAYVVDGGDQPQTGPDRARIVVAGPDGAPITSFATFGNQDGELIWPHDIAIGLDGSVYVVEVGAGRRCQKFERF